MVITIDNNGNVIYGYNIEEIQDQGHYIILAGAME